jgi:beta-galactosidase
VKIDNESFDWSIWADVLDPVEGTQVLARYNDQFYKGKTAAITRLFGKGTVSYIGADSYDGRLEKKILQKVYANAGIQLANLPDDLIVEWREGFWVALNYSSTTVEAPVPANATILIGKKSLEPAEVVVWKE